MASIDTVDAAGKKTGSRDLPADVFEAPVNVPLMHQVVVASMAGLRAGTHKVKTRGEVRGGGKKPWRQKGTGRARQGSIRSPQWVGGGVAHGPVVRDHNQRINKKMVKGALRSALTDALAERQADRGRRPRFEEPKTRQAADALAALGCEGRVLLVLREPDRGERRREVVPQPPDGQGGLRARPRHLRRAAGRPRGVHRRGARRLGGG